MTGNLRSKKVDNRDNSFPQLPLLQNYLLMIIINTPEYGLSNVKEKYNTRKVRTSLVN